VPRRPQPIRVLRVIARLNVGGPALHVSYLSRELDRIGYETTLVAGRIGGSEGSMEYIADELGVEPLYVPELQREISPIADAIASRRLLKIIRDIRPDVLHTHTAKAGAVGRMAALMAGPARPRVVVHTFHGHVLRGYFSPAKTEAFRQLERWLARGSDALIAVSPEVRDDLVSLGVAPAGKIAVVRLGLDFDARLATPPDARRRLRGELGVDGDAFVIAWLGRMTEIKRADDLLRAFARMREHRDDAVLLMVGDGPLRGELETLARELGIAESTRFTGFRGDVGSIYAAADVVALTSANEGTPVSVIEAQAAGLPVVSTDVGGVRDVVSDGESGFVVERGDVAGVSDRLERLALDPALRERMGVVGHGRATARYGVPRLVSDIDTLYRELLRQADVPTRRVIRERPVPLAPSMPELRVGRTQRSLRILLVSQYFPPEVGATQSRMQSFAEYLAERGHRVTVIAEFPNHPQGVMPEAYHGRVFEDDRSNPYRVLRVWVKTSSEKTQMTRLSFYLSFMALATAIAPLAGPADVVVATTPPLFTAMAGLAIARMNAAPFVLDVRDLWPAAATSLMQISPGWETRAAESIERRLYRSAAVATAVTRPFCDHIDELRGSSGPRTVLLPNGTIPQFFDARDDGARQRLGIPNDRFLITFAGILGIAQALPATIDAAALLGDAAELLLIGDGPMKTILLEQVRREGIDNVRFHAQIPLAEIPPILAASDALLVPLSAHPTFEQFVPSKLIDFMAVGRPVVLSAAGEAARIVERSGGGLAVPPEDPEALAAAVRRLAAHPHQAKAMGERGRAFALRRLRSTQAERLEQVLFDAVRVPVERR
jgi:glycosyltransferase involved in cell wall biosynthesis